MVGAPQAQSTSRYPETSVFAGGGRSLYGLARHGLIPATRSLAEVAYAVLLASPRSLHIEEVDFILEQMNYRFNADSLAHHLRGYTDNRWDLCFQTDSRRRVFVNTGRDARHSFNSRIRVCATNAAFDAWLTDVLVPAVETALSDRSRRLDDIKVNNASMAGDRIEFGAP